MLGKDSTKGPMFPGVQGQGEEIKNLKFRMQNYI
jgi:hypothetical protein